MHSKDRVLNIVWAVDITDLESVVQKPVLDSIKNLASYCRVNLQLVYVLSSKDNEIPISYLDFQMSEFERQTQTEFKEHCRHFTFISVQGKFVSDIKLPLEKGIEVLDKFAQSLDVDFIIVNSHARKGLKYLTLGSFAEALLARAITPVLVFNPNTKPLTPQNLRILFPTDGSRVANDIYKKALLWGYFFQAPVTVLKLTRMLSMYFFNVSKKIVKAAFEGNCGLIIMTAVGSTTRDVIRRSLVPVLSIPKGIPIFLK